MKVLTVRAKVSDGQTSLAANLWSRMGGRGGEKEGRKERERVMRNL